MIFSPTEIVRVEKRDANARIDWLVSVNEFESALEIVSFGESDKSVFIV